MVIGFVASYPSPEVGAAPDIEKSYCPLLIGGHSIGAVHDDGSAQRSKVQDRVSRPVREHELSISLMKCNVVTYARATGEIRLSLHDHFKRRCKS
jgi:hypothetical protein